MTAHVSIELFNLGIGLGTVFIVIFIPIFLCEARSARGLEMRCFGATARRASDMTLIRVRAIFVTSLLRLASLSIAKAREFS
jgi:hypothetical protein